MKKKSKGGKRVGAGRPALSDAKVNIPLRVAESDVKKWGGKNELKKKLYDFIAFPGQVGGVSFVELPFSPKTHKEAKNKVIRDLTAAAAKEVKAIMIKDLPEALLEPQEQPKTKLYDIETNNTILKEIEVIKAEKMPPERNTPLGKKAWQMDQQKRIQELKAKIHGD